MRTFTQRFLGTIAAVLIAAALGAWIGARVGQEVVLRHGIFELDQYATLIRDDIEKSSTESRRVLAELNSSSLPKCSDREIAYLRSLIFGSKYLKDAGRMHDGHLECSATFGRIRQPAQQYQPLFTLKDGVRLYRDLPPFRVPGETVVAVQRDDAYAVYDPYNLANLRRAPMHYTMFDRDLATNQTRRLVGDLPDTSGPMFIAEGTLRTAQTLYATRCSARHTACITAFMSIGDALSIARRELRGYLVLSSICGALFGLVCSTLYRRNKAIQQQLRRAIRRNQLTVAYQPIFDLTTGQMEGAEALARWTDEDGYVVSPEVFIKIAEERGFISEITRSIVQQATRDLKKILETRPDFRVNVNIAPADLTDPDFVPTLEQALAHAAVPAHAVGIEITESSTARVDAARKTILELREKGHTVHIDDFGTGYSNLAYLHDLSVDYIKIDRAFTQSIGTDSVKVSILPQIFSMAQTLNLQVVVEGIETEDQARFFAAIHPHICAQGWLLSRPVPLPDLIHLLEQEAANQDAPARYA